LTKRSVRLISLIIVAVAAVAPSARAGWETTRASVIARIVWHDPCGRAATLQFGPIPDDGPDALAAADQPACRVYVTRSNLAFPVLCTVLLHEYGHLAGFRDPTNTADPEHSDNPNSIMAATQVFTHAFIHHKDGTVSEQWAGTDRRCDDRGRPFLLAHLGDAVDLP
jgi:hypothetical protein